MDTYDQEKILTSFRQQVQSKVVTNGLTLMPSGPVHKHDITGVIVILSVN